MSNFDIMAEPGTILRLLYHIEIDRPGLPISPTIDSILPYRHPLKILWGEQHALAVDHILDTLLVPAGTRAARHEPEPWAGHRLGTQVIEKVQMRNAKEVFFCPFCASPFGRLEGLISARSDSMECRSLRIAPGGMTKSAAFFFDPRSRRLAALYADSQLEK